MCEDLNLSTDDTSEIDYSPDVIIDGRSYWRSPAHQVASHICKKTYDDFILSAEYDFSSAKIFMERIIEKPSVFTGGKKSPKKCLGVLYYDTDTDQIKLIKTMVDETVHEFHKDDKRKLDDCFGVHYDIFRYLRDDDLIVFKTIERKVRNKENFVYVVKKNKSRTNGAFLTFQRLGNTIFYSKNLVQMLRKGQTPKNGKNKKVRSKNGYI